MGGGHWSDDEHAVKSAVKASRVASGGASFAYTNAVSTGAAPRKVHDRLDPKRVAGPASPFAGKVMRESRDSADHPNSLAIGVIFDVTGSMGAIPVTLEKKLAGLMALLVRKGYVTDPQILFGAIGDANSDQGPLQMGQFESDATMDDDLDHIWVEGGGGGQKSETYELAHYFFLHHTATDCWDKRRKKGYLFTVGDERFYDTIHKRQVDALIGDKLETDLTTEGVVRDLQERWNVFHIIAEQGSYPNDKDIEVPWVRMLGERVLKLADADNVAELIALTIGLSEGTTDIDAATTDLKDIGTPSTAIMSVTTALAPLAKSTAGLTRTELAGTLPTVAGGGTTERL